MHRQSTNVGDLGRVDQLSLAPSTFLLRYATGLDTLEAAQALQVEAEVDWAEPDYEVRKFDSRDDFFIDDEFSDLSLFNDDPIFSLPFNDVTNDPKLKDTWGIHKIEAPAAWGKSKGSRRIVVGDIDTGIDYNHEDLAENMWRNPNPDPVKNDVYGYDFFNNDGDPMDGHSHGTHVAGTIGAVGNNNVGTVGVNQKVALMAIKFLSDRGSGSTSAGIKSIDYAVNKGAKIINASWGGGGFSRAMADSIERAKAKGVLFVAAAGNSSANTDRRPMYPAAYESTNIISVAATTSSDGMASFSNYGATTVDVGAPGHKVLSTTPKNRYATYSGTSMASPHVAGLAALILSHRPDLNLEELKAIIMNTGDKISSLDGKTLSGARINARKALEAALMF